MHVLNSAYSQLPVTISAKLAESEQENMLLPKKMENVFTIGYSKFEDLLHEE